MNDSWKKAYPSWILERGSTYHQMGRVHRLTHRGNEISAVVEGTEVYHVTVRFSRGIPESASCDCPHARGGNLCKHTAALLYALEELGYTPEDDPSDPDWEDALEKLPPETLRILLRNLAEQEPRLQALILQLYELQNPTTQSES